MHCIWKRCRLTTTKISVAKAPNFAFAEFANNDLKCQFSDRTYGHGLASVEQPGTEAIVGVEVRALICYTVAIGFRAYL